MKTLIVTGAYGLVGSNFIDAVPKYFDEQIKVIKVKFDDLSRCEPADYILHAAGYGQPLKFSEDKVNTISINTKTTMDLFHYLKPQGKFLFVSSSEVYSGAESPYTEEMIGTTTPEHPRACYIEGKRCGEAICHAYRQSGWDVKIARLALAYGPGTKPGDTRVLNQFIEQGFNGEIELRDAGQAQRTYIYIDDAVDLLWKILLKGKDCTYNVGGFSTVTVLELANEIGKLMNVPVTMPESDKGLKDAPTCVMLDMDKTLKEFNQSFVPLQKGLQRTIRYQQDLYGYC